MDIVKYFNELLHVYEVYLDGGITDDERDFILYEMKSRHEYLHRRIPNLFEFKPFELDSTGECVIGELILDGFVVEAILVPDKKIILPNGTMMDISTSCDPITGMIRINGNMLIDMHKDIYRKGILYHELGHYKFHALPNIDAALSRIVLLQIINDIVNTQYINRPKNMDSVSYANACTAYFKKLYNVYSQKLDQKPSVSRNNTLNEYRQECIKIFNKFRLGGHTVAIEFEADKFAANKIGIREMIKSLKNSRQLTIKQNKKYFQIRINDLKHEYDTIKREIITSSDPETKNDKLQKLKLRYLDSYENIRNIYNDNYHRTEMDVKQRIKVLTDLDILMDNRFRDLYQ